MNYRFHRPAQVRAAGFTLLEIVLAMFIFSLLIASIFGIVSGTTQLADEMERGHEHDAQSHSFAQFCERTLRQLPAQAVVRLRVKESGHQYLSQFAILNAPSILGSGVGGGNGLTILETEQQPDGYLRVQVKIIGEEDIAAYEAGQGKVGGGLVLLNDVARFEWKCFNPLTNEWETIWNDKMSFANALAATQAPSLAQGAPGQPAANGAVPPGNGVQSLAPGQPPPLAMMNQMPRPNLIELTLGMGADPPRRFVFWVPPAQIPSGVGMQNSATIPVAPVATPGGAPGVTPPPVK